MGSQEVGSWFRRDREAGVALSSSDCNVATRDSRSITYSMSSKQEQAEQEKTYLLLKANDACPLLLQQRLIFFGRACIKNIFSNI